MICARCQYDRAEETGSEANTAYDESAYHSESYPHPNLRDVTSQSEPPTDDGRHPRA